MRERVRVGVGALHAGQQLNRPEVLRWAETVSRGSPVRSDAPRIPDSGDRPRRGEKKTKTTTIFKKNPSWQPQLARVLRMNTSCTRSSASKALLRFKAFFPSVRGCRMQLDPPVRARTERDAAPHLRALMDAA